MSRLRAYKPQLIVAALTWVTAAYFFQGGGWNQNAHFATTVALVDDGTINLDRYRQSTGDLSHRAGGHVVSAKAVATALVSVPGYLVSKPFSAVTDNVGNRIIASAYITSALSAALALALLALAFLKLLRPHLDTADAMLLSLAMTLATPLGPNATMLTSHPWAMASAVGALSFLSINPERLNRIKISELFWAGLLTGSMACFEYMLIVLWLPLGGLALYRTKSKLPRVLWFAAGAACVVWIPLLHHQIAYGHPFATGYGRLVNSKFAHDAGLGFMGFNGLNFRRFYELTFGDIRGFFFLSPFLVAAVPGLLRGLQSKRLRATALSVGIAAWGVLVLVSALVYWHSGSATGSRYALAFVAFSALPIAWLFPYHRRWIQIGIAVSAFVMLLAVSTTAIPPTPARQPPYDNVVAFWFERFSQQNLASWQQYCLRVNGIGDGKPTWPFAFNLGQALGLPGLWSLAPLASLWAAVVVFWTRITPDEWSSQRTDAARSTSRR